LRVWWRQEMWHAKARWSNFWLHLQKLTDVLLSCKFLAFYGNRRFITMFRSLQRWSLPWAVRLHSTPFRSLSFKIPFYIALPSALSHQTPARISLLPPACRIFSHLILFWCGQPTHLSKHFSPSSWNFLPVDLNIFLSTKFLGFFSVYLRLYERDRGTRANKTAGK
jgi:hypothetical protein